jgi:hypothetical protein
MARTSATDTPATAGDALTRQEAAFLYLYRRLRPEGQAAFHAFLIETEGMAEGPPMRDACRHLCGGLGMTEGRASAEAERICGAEFWPAG